MQQPVPNLKADINTLVKLIRRDHNHVEAQQMLYELLLPGTDKSNLRRNPIYRLLADHPNALGLRSVAIRLCRAVGDYEQRLSHLEALHRAGARAEGLYVEHGAMLRDNGRFAEGLRLAEEGLAAFPGSLDLLRLRGNLHLILGHHGQARADWARVAEAAGDPQARFAMHAVDLLISDCQKGLEGFAAQRDRMIAENRLSVGLPEWNGEPLSGRRLLLWSNEGVGDVAMSAGFIPWLTRQGGTLTLACSEKLYPLLKRSFPDVEVVHNTGELLARTDGHDWQLALSQLLARGIPRFEPASHPPYLKTDGECVARLREKYLAIASQRERKKLVGISWFTQNKDAFSQRNLPLSKWKPLLEVLGVQFVSLQYGDHAAEIAEVNRAMKEAVYADPEIDAFCDIDGLCAQIAAMDEVVTIDNATVHFAGGLGVPATLLLSAAPEWRWGLERRRSRWYASVTLERQERLGDWPPVLRRIRERWNR